jgi:hypothetical protein
LPGSPDDCGKRSSEHGAPATVCRVLFCGAYFLLQQALGWVAQGFSTGRSTKSGDKPAYQHGTASLRTLTFLTDLLWLATLNRDSRHFRDLDVCQITTEVLKPYQLKIRWDKVIGAGDGQRNYPKRDYQRQFWESDWVFLDRIWQEWGLTFFWDADTLVLIDNHAYGGDNSAVDVSS